MKPYSAEFRGEVLAACDANEGTQAVALRFGVSESWVRRTKQQRRETGQVAPRKASPRKPKWHAWADWLLAIVAVFSSRHRRRAGQSFVTVSPALASYAVDNSRRKVQNVVTDSSAEYLDRTGSIMIGESRRKSLDHYSQPCLV